MTVEPLQQTNKEIRRHLYKSLHAFLNLHDPQFCLKVSHFISKSTSYLELIKSYCSVQGRSYLLNENVDPVVHKLKKKLNKNILSKKSCPVKFCIGHVIK